MTPQSQRRTLSTVGLVSALAFLLPTILLLTSLFPNPAHAQTATPTIYNGSDKYKYQGCYNETVGIPGTAGDRAISDGTHQVAEGTMTVPMCLSFCSSNGTTYKYAGLEFSRECWCGDRLSGLAVKEAQGDCNLQCDGNKEMACGGSLKLSVYMLSAAPSNLAMSGALAALMVGIAALLNIL